MKLTRTISGEAAFEDAEARAYYDLAAALNPGSVIVEIGLQYGRSSSIVLQVASEAGHEYHGVDPWESPEVNLAWMDMASRATRGIVLHQYPSMARDVEAWPDQIHLALIDGDHDAPGVRTDCQVLLPRIAVGGHVCAHDYGRDSLPDVYPTMNEEIQRSCDAGAPFIHVGTYGTLGVWQRV